MGSARATARTIRANGITHHVLEWDGPVERTVILLHGFLDQSDSFTDVAHGLSRTGRRVLVPDFRGHGRSSWIPEGGYYHFADYLADVHALLDELAPTQRTQQVSVVGHSMGGTVATLFSGTFPERVRALALIEGLGPPRMPPEVAPDRMRQWIAQLGMERVRTRRKFRTYDEVMERLKVIHSHVVSPEVLERVARAMSEPHPSGDGLTWRFDPLHQTMSPSRFDEDSFLEFARRIVAPVLLVDAGASGMVVPEIQARASQIANVRRATLEGAGHMIHWTQPDALVGVLTAFFDETA